MQSIYDQLFAFLVTIGIGFLAGILFDFYRVFRGLWRPKKLGTFVGDILFWFVMTVVVFTLLLVGNWGEIRIYVFIGVGLGAYLYVRFFSKRWQKLIRSIFIYLGKILVGFWKVVTWPFKMVGKIVLVPVGFIFSGLAVGFGMMQKGFKAMGKKIAAWWPFRVKQPDDKE